MTSIKLFFLFCFHSLAYGSEIGTIGTKQFSKKSSFLILPKDHRDLTSENIVPWQDYTDNIKLYCIEMAKITKMNEKIRKGEPLYFSNLQSVDNFINRIDLNRAGCDFWTIGTKSCLYRCLDYLSESLPYNNKDHTFAHDDRVIAHFLKILEAISNKDLNNEKELNEQLGKIQFSRNKANHQISVQLILSENNNKTLSSITAQKPQKPTTTIDQPKEKAVSNKKQNKFILGQRPNSERRTSHIFHDFKDKKGPYSNAIRQKEELCLQDLQKGTATVYFPSLEAINNFWLAYIDRNSLQNPQLSQIVLNAIEKLKVYAETNSKPFDIEPNRYFLSLLQDFCNGIIDEKTLKKKIEGNHHSVQRPDQLPTNTIGNKDDEVTPSSTPQGNKTIPLIPEIKKQGENNRKTFWESLKTSYEKNKIYINARRIFYGSLLFIGSILLMRLLYSISKEPVFKQNN